MHDAAPAGLIITVFSLLLCSGCPIASAPDTAAPPLWPENIAAQIEPAALDTPVAGTDCVAPGEPAGEMQQELYAMLNQYRSSRGLPPLVYSRTLEAAAQAYVQDLYTRAFFDHINPEGQTPGDRALAAGFCSQYVGENLAAGQKSVDAVMQAWENSPGHNANMLDSGYRYVGIGVFQSPFGRLYWAQEFAFAARIP